MRDERRWGSADAVLEGLRDHGIAPVVTLYGAPRWANGGRAPSWAPTSGSTFAAFASAAAKRYPWVKLWLVWNEPNQRRWLRPTTPSTYVTQAVEPRVRGDSPGEPRCQGRWRRDRSARVDRWCLARGMDSRHGGVEGAPGRIRAQSLSAAAARNAFDRRLRATARRSRWRRSSGSSVRSCADSARGCGSG